jgi:hypothetical protein
MKQKTSEFITWPASLNEVIQFGSSMWVFSHFAIHTICYAHTTSAKSIRVYTGRSEVLKSTIQSLNPTPNHVELVVYAYFMHILWNLEV